MQQTRKRNCSKGSDTVTRVLVSAQLVCNISSYQSPEEQRRLWSTSQCTRKLRYRTVHITLRASRWRMGGVPLALTLYEFRHTLKKLVLRNLGISTDSGGGFSAIVQWLPQLLHLEHLDLSGNPIAAKGLSELATALSESNSQIHTLNLSDIRASYKGTCSEKQYGVLHWTPGPSRPYETDCSQDDRKKFGEHAKDRAIHGHLDDLRTFEYMFGTLRGVTDFIGVLHQMTHLTELDLSNNELFRSTLALEPEVQWCTDLYNALVGLPLRSLNLSENRVKHNSHHLNTDDLTDSSALLDALLGADCIPILETLDISGNHLYSPSQAEDLAKRMELTQGQLRIIIGTRSSDATSDFRKRFRQVANDKAKDSVLI